MGDIASYAEAVRWIHSNIRAPADALDGSSSYSLAERRQRRLARLRSFLALLGHPERQFVPIHVAGTSGKGSVCAIISSISAAAGRRTGLHVSPYLQTPIEKLVINGRMMAVARFVRLVQWYRQQVEAFNATSDLGPLRYGEVWVALTYAAYAAERVEVGVVEVGAGGRWDYTNVIQPDVSIINKIGYDHILTLGPTIRDIAYHKAGIIKWRTPVVVATQPEQEALEVILKEAEQQQAPLVLEGRDFAASPLLHADAGTSFAYRDREVSWESLRVPLAGPHQVRNAALAIAAARTLWPSIQHEQVARGLAAVRFPGRLEKVQSHPTVFLDGAHNSQKAAALIEALRVLLPEGTKIIYVLGILASHQPEEVVRLIASTARAVVCTSLSVVGKTAVDAEDLAALCRHYCPSVEAIPDTHLAIQRAITLAESDGTVCVTGSLYLVGAARSLWVSEVELLDTAWHEDEDPLPTPRLDTAPAG
ncbi:MAG: Mur ligase family protein [Chloroflexi bacterium]|nr:Mur ligase family protein [Chloroflexota bacterium]